MKAESLHTLSKTMRLSKLEEETRANMSLLRKTTRLAQGDTAKMEGPETVQVHVDTTPHTHTDVHELCKMIDEGKLEEVKEKLKKIMTGKMSEEGSDVVGETHKQLSALAESVSKMQNNFDALEKLAKSLVPGI
jgi:transcriptional regulator of heat shock response